jgi:hypothetical protein
MCSPLCYLNREEMDLTKPFSAIEKKWTSFTKLVTMCKRFFLNNTKYFIISRNVKRFETFSYMSLGGKPVYRSGDGAPIGILAADSRCRGSPDRRTATVGHVLADGGMPTEHDVTSGSRLRRLASSSSSLLSSSLFQTTRA